MENKAKIITVAGKGGVGKTSICASIVRLLVEQYPDKKILAIDADPAVGLSVALGVDVKLTLDDIRMSIVDSVENGETRERSSFSARPGSVFSTRWWRCPALLFWPSAARRGRGATAR
ncbi:MAG: AAA family ATPase [Oscillospiraceae bacterium]|nr:AAA family ATPase [Oscillospiraceae bacterium]